MATLPYMPRNIAHLDATHINVSGPASALSRLLEEKFWLADGDLAFRPDEMHLLVRFPKELFDALFAELCDAGIWFVNACSRLCNNTLAQVFDRTLTHSKKLSNAGKKAVGVRELRRRERKCATAVQSIDDPIKTKELLRNSTSAQPAGCAPECESSPFERFWVSYGLKRNRARALRYWLGKGLDAKVDELIADVQRRKAGDRHWKAGYQPHPSRYLSDELWNDELAPELPPAGQGRAFSYAQRQADVAHQTVPPEASTVLGMVTPKGPSPEALRGLDRQHEARLEGYARSGSPRRLSATLQRVILGDRPAAGVADDRGAHGGDAPGRQAAQMGAAHVQGRAGVRSAL